MLLALCCSSAFAQQHPFNRFDEAWGLPVAPVHSIVQDHRGFLWISFENHSVARFDGREIKYLSTAASHIPPDVFALAADGMHSLFAGGAFGVRCLRLLDHGMEYPDTALNVALSEIPGPVRELYMNSAFELYIRTPKQAWLFNVRDTTLTSSGILPARHAFLQSMFPELELRSMSRGCTDRIWLATPRGLVLKEDAATELFDASNGLPVENVRTVYRDDEGNVWVGTSEGLFKHTPKRIVNYLPGRELAPDAEGVSSILETMNRTVWIGTIGGGLTRLFDGATRTFRVRDGLPSDTITSLMELPTGDVLIATTNGVALYVDKRIESLANRLELPDPHVTVLFQASDRRFWVATRKGLLSWDGTNVRVYTSRDGLPSDHVTALVEDAMGFLWVGTNNGVARINLASGYTYSADGLQDVNVSALYIDAEHRIWAGTVGSGVIINRYRALTVDDGFDAMLTQFIVEDEHGTVYIGSNNGVYAIERDNIRLFLKERQPRIISGVLPSVALASLRSVALFSIGSGMGLAGNEMQTGAVFRDASGRLWFGTRNGASCYTPTPPRLLRSGAIPGCPQTIDAPTPRRRIILTEVCINDTCTAVGNYYELGPRDYIFRVRCTVPTFRNPGSVLFHYRMEGLEYTWHKSYDGRMSYSNLPPGTYRLIVRASLGEGLWTRHHEVLRVSVRAPFYRTSGFILFAFVAAALLGALLVSLHSRKTLEVEHSRTRMAATFQGDIGENLQKIACSGEDQSTGDRGRIQSGAQERLERLGDFARESISDMSDLVWLLNSEYDCIHALARRIALTVDEVQHLSDSRVETRIDNLKDSTLHPDMRRAMFAIFKEALRNAMRHSSARKIVVAMRQEQRNTILCVQDDGHGFDTTIPSTGSGLIAMHRYASEMGWVLTLRSDTNGTMVELNCTL